MRIAAAAHNNASDHDMTSADQSESDDMTSGPEDIADQSESDESLGFWISASAAPASIQDDAAKPSFN